MPPEIINQIVELINHVISESEKDLVRAYVGKGEQNKMRIHVPDFLLYFLKEGFSRYTKMHIAAEGKFAFRGYEILPGYEMAIVVFHIDYPLYRKSWMYKKIPLEPSQMIEYKNFHQTIVQLRKMMNYPTSNPSEN